MHAVRSTGDPAARNPGWAGAVARGELRVVTRRQAAALYAAEQARVTAARAANERRRVQVVAERLAIGIMVAALLGAGVILRIAAIDPTAWLR